MSPVCPAPLLEGIVANFTISPKSLALILVVDVNIDKDTVEMEKCSLSPAIRLSDFFNILPEL